MRKPLPPPPSGNLIRSLDAVRLLQLMGSGVPAAPDGRYRHWHTLRHCPTPAGFTSEEWWLAIKFARASLRKMLPLQDASGRPLHVAIPEPAQAMLMTIDQQASGRLTAPELVASPANRDRYLVSSLIEEAIRSSQLEGAATTRQVAKEMLRSGREPKDRHERMIANNYHAMNLVRQWRDEELTPERVLELHKVVTEGTLKDPGDAGRLQTPGEERIKIVWDDRQILYEPPPAEQLQERLMRMCAFANGEGTEGFLHPVVRAVLLHFWLAYDHPFVDGNGRTARALFYWSMLRQGYWLAEFLSISSVIRQAPARYAESFLYVETDDGDTTYFLLSQLRIICRAIESLYAYLDRKSAEIREVEAIVRQAPGFNHRQLALLAHALRDPDAQYTLASHQRSHNIAYGSARNDLLDLARRGLLHQSKRGQAFVFFPPRDLDRRLKALAR